MVHLRIADELLTRIKGLNEETFILGNIAPDSGVPNEDWSSFTPPGNVTHYRDNDKDKTHINIDKYVSEYLTKEKIESYTVREFSFYLGYYTHLLTDIEWAKMVYSEGVDEEHARRVNMTLNEFIWKNKEDWYDLDFLYLEQHPAIKAFCVFKHAEGFANTFMDIFSPDAFENRRQYICSFYHSDEHGILQREYPYLTEEQAAAFVKETSMWILHHMPSPA
jgi:hypothetical protein